MATDWQLPKPLSTIEVVVDQETRITVRRHGNPLGPRLVLGHGNGLAIDLYYPFWSELANDFELIIFDLRNHGWNERTSKDDHNVISLVSDLDHVMFEVEKQYGKKPSLGVLHSVSALVALLYSSGLIAETLERRWHGFNALVLFDPPMYRPGQSHAEFDEAVELRATQTRKRTFRFKSREQLIELLDFSPAYSRLVTGAKELMAHTILKKSDDQPGYELRCPPDYEAKIVGFFRAFADQVDLDKLPCPVRVIGSDPLLPSSYLPTVDLSHMLHVDFDFLPDATHYMQIEQPKECAKFVREFVSSTGFA